VATVLFITTSLAGKPIRLTRKVWEDKICSEHPELAKRPNYLGEVRRTVEEPDYLVAGWRGEMLALRRCEIAPKRPKYLCVVYRELNGDGFIITAFFVSRLQNFLKRGVLWQRNP
jgi:hypothetical protein